MKEYYDKHLGEVYERLTILSVTRESGKPKFHCSCSCGGDLTADVFSILSKKTRSCGCLKREIIQKRFKGKIKPAVQIGQKFTNRKGDQYEVVEYIKSSRVLVRFTETGFEKWSATKEILKCCVRDDSLVKVVAEKPKTLRNIKPPLKVGDIFENYYGEKYEVVEVFERPYCRVRFMTPPYYEKVAHRDDARSGVRNPYRICYGLKGYMGVGDFNSINDSAVFRIWNNMHVRCGDNSGKNTTYEDCHVNEIWHNFQNFAKWVYDNNEYISNKDWNLDKDILFRNNKIYGPDTCCFVPTEINNLFTLRANKRGLYPIGVHLSKTAKGTIRFVAQCNIKGKRKGLGYFDSPEEAFLVYKQAKEEEVKRVANIYKDKIDPRVYEALLKWEVEITD